MPASAQTFSPYFIRGAEVVFLSKEDISFEAGQALGYRLGMPTNLWHIACTHTSAPGIRYEDCVLTIFVSDPLATFGSVAEYHPFHGMVFESHEAHNRFLFEHDLLNFRVYVEA